MKKLTIKAILCTAALAAGSYAMAEISLDELMSEGVDYESENSRTVSTNTINIPLKDKPKSTVKRPVRQNSQSMVLNKFGQPLKKYPAKGKPPISRWDYAKFTVYFESEYVIHSVVKSNQ
jgi:hypothetical protein